MGDDPLERLLGELLDAHDRQQTDDKSQPAPDRLPRPGRRRILVFAVLTLAVSTSAAAAVVIGTQRSAPLTGTLPHQLLGSRYVLRVAPDLEAGHADWCIALLDIGTGTSVLPTPSNCVTPSGGPLVARGGIATISPSTGAVQGWLLYAIVNRQVAALRTPNGVRILPISSPQLPSGWRAAVTIQTSPSRPAAHPALATLTPLSTTGATLPASTGKSLVLPTLAVNPDTPPRIGCRIDFQHVSGIRLLKASALRRPLPRALPVTSGFLSCYTVTFDLQRSASRAVLLLDARHPGSSPAALPGTTRMSGQQGVWVGPTVGESQAATAADDRLFAKRIQDAWLVIQTSAPTGEVLVVLRHLTADV